MPFASVFIFLPLSVLTTFGLKLEHTNSQYFGAPWAMKYGDFLASHQQRYTRFGKLFAGANDLAPRQKLYQIVIALYLKDRYL